MIKITTTIIAGFILLLGFVFSFWNRSSPDHIHGLATQERRTTIMFDSSTAGRLQSHDNSLPRLDEPVQITFIAPSTYKIKTQTLGVLEFDSAPYAPHTFTCISCPQVRPSMDGLWFGIQ